MIFISDHLFIEKDGKYYTTGSLNSSIIKRYVNMVGNLKIVGYVKKYNDSYSKYIKDGNIASGADFILYEKKNNPIHIRSVFKKIKKIIDQYNPIIIRMSILGLLACNYCRKKNYNYLVEIVASTWDSLWYHSIKGKIIAPFINLYTKKEIKKAPNAIYVTDKYLQKKYPNKGNNIGISDVAITNQEKIEIKKLNNCLNIGTLANIEVKYKGQADVFKAIKILKSKGMKIKYILIGAGNKSRLQKLAIKYNIIEDVDFIGPVPHDNIYDQLMNLDLYVQPSYQEGLPRAVIEAMCIGLPCIGSNAGGIPELLDSKYIFKKGDYKKIVKIIENISYDELKNMSDYNYNISKKYYSHVLDEKRNLFYKHSLLGSEENEK